LFFLVEHLHMPEDRPKKARQAPAAVEEAEEGAAGDGDAAAEGAWLLPE
jgi:hypothetical protein